MKTFQLKSPEAFLDGWGAQSLLTTDIRGFGPFKEVDIWGHDPGSDTIHMFTVTNAGQTHDHAGKFRDDEALMLTYRAREGQPSPERTHRLRVEDSARGCSS
jgi:hypothetical protein